MGGGDKKAMKISKKKKFPLKLIFFPSDWSEKMTLGNTIYHHEFIHRSCIGTYKKFIEMIEIF